MIPKIQCNAFKEFDGHVRCTQSSVFDFHVYLKVGAYVPYQLTLCVWVFNVLNFISNNCPRLNFWCEAKEYMMYSALERFSLTIATWLGFAIERLFYQFVVLVVL